MAESDSLSEDSMKSSSNTVTFEFELALQVEEKVAAESDTQGEPVLADKCRGELAVALVVSLTGVLGNTLSTVRFVYSFPVGVWILVDLGACRDLRVEVGIYSIFLIFLVDMKNSFKQFKANVNANANAAGDNNGIAQMVRPAE